MSLKAGFVFKYALLAVPAIVFVWLTQFELGFRNLIASVKLDDDVTFHSSVARDPKYIAELEQLGLTNNAALRISSAKFNKTLHGRFLHITDLHPDHFYKEGATIETACHAGKGNASKYGDAMAGCDSPFALVQETLDWVEKNLRDKIDYIIWTGDNVRHDNDRQIPRTELQIFEVNKNVSDIMVEKFKDYNTPDPRVFEVPLIPSLGNNDVYPHNLFAIGPTLQSRLLFKTWSPFIPQDQMHIFEKTASFVTEVIPNQLAVLSINTLFMFKSNPLVDNCDLRKQPGYSLFLWLGYTLKELRRRGVKVWVSGHVPPVPKNYDITCYRKYTLWMYEYRDIIIGNLFGHMNLDHFVPLDAVLAYQSLKKDTLLPGYQDLVANFHAKFEDLEELQEHENMESMYLQLGIPLDPQQAAAALSSELHASGAAPGLNKLDYLELVNEIFYSSLVKPDVRVSRKKKHKNKNKNDGTRYSIVHVAASVIPTFNPGMRVWEYNLTGLERSYSAQNHESWGMFFAKLDTKIDNIVNQPDYAQEYQELFGKKPDKSLPPKSKKSLPLGPAFVPQTFTPTGFAQYYLDLDAVNSGKKPFGYELEYTSRSKPYQMDSLLADDWVKLAMKLSKAAGSKKKKKQNVWRKYLQRAFVSTDYEDIIEERRGSK